MRSNVVIWHNPRCSKSRETLALLLENGVQPFIREYLVDRPSFDELRQVLGKLGVEARAWLRRQEDVYKTHYAGHVLSDDDVLHAMVEHPVLIERPVVISGARAVIGRPPENVLAII